MTKTAKMVITKLISIVTAVTAVAIAASSMTALTAFAADKITADEVKEMVYSTGLSAYPEALNLPAKNMDADEDVLNPATQNISDIIDITSTYRQFNFIDSDNPFGEDPEAYILFHGYDTRGILVYIYYYPEQYIAEEDRNTVEYEFTVTDEEYSEGIHNSYALWDDYEEIADIINESGVKDITEIKIISSRGDKCVYVKGDDEYAIPCYPRTTSDGEKIESGVIIPFADWCAFTDKYEEEEFGDDINIITGSGSPEYIDVRDTDTRAAYIGTESRFSDVSGGLVSYVNELNELGIINGYDENLFMPEKSITRAEAVAMLARMLKCTGSYNGEFADVSSGDWFADDVAALTAAGYINGYDDTTFAPYADIKYQEVMKILVFALGYANKFNTMLDDYYPSETNKTAMEIGLTDGLNSFDTAAPITRGDMAIMLSNALDTHLWTTVTIVQDGWGVSSAKEDITLIDYLNGKQLNGHFAVTNPNE